MCGKLLREGLSSVPAAAERAQAGVVRNEAGYSVLVADADGVVARSAGPDRLDPAKLSAFTLTGSAVGGTALTLVFLPALYAIWYRIRPAREQARQEETAFAPGAS